MNLIHISRMDLMLIKRPSSDLKVPLVAVCDSFCVAESVASLLKDQVVDAFFVSLSIVPLPRVFEAQCPVDIPAKKAMRNKLKPVMMKRLLAGGEGNFIWLLN